MFAEIISRPVSGQYPEKHFGAISPNCLWVKFTDNDFQSWVGSFQQGWEGYGTFIIVVDKQGKAFVVAGGQSCLVDISSRQLINTIEISRTKSALLNDEQTKFYFSNGYDLQVMDLDGNVSVLFDSHYFDDIELIEIKGNKLYAKYWHYQRDTEPFYLEINLQTKELIDSYYDSDKQEYTNEISNPSWFDKITSWLKK
ncbi:MAG: hypothetical protein EOP48_34170 [Sphingobacteriales bacterium]|nr:MAG: hypothetical protein EOP48_34170 [Sphingobacteriales bacterium]